MTLPADLPDAPPLRLLAGDDPRESMLAAALVAMVKRAGWDLKIVGREERKPGSLPQYDVRIERSWGIPYDPDVTLAARFLPRGGESAAEAASAPLDGRLAALIEQARSEAEPLRRRAVHARIQELMDEQVLVIPLYAPRRVAVFRKGLPPPDLDHDLYRLPASLWTRSP